MAYLDHWVIYDHPDDAPQHWVVRRWRIESGRREPAAGIGFGFDTIEDARASIPIASLGLVRIPRSLDDDPVIVETWI